MRGHLELERIVETRIPRADVLQQAEQQFADVLLTTHLGVVGVQPRQPLAEVPVPDGAFHACPVDDIFQKETNNLPLRLGGLKRALPNLT